MKILRWFAYVLLNLLILIAFAWAFGALYYDGPSKLFAAVNLLGILAAFVFVRPCWRKLSVFGIWFAVVLGWWLTLKPSAQGKWQADVAQLPWAEIAGDEITIHNVRNFDYRTETDFTQRWETRKLRLSQLTGIDIFMNYWGSPWMAHPIVSFQFADSAPICFSIETRKKDGQSYSAIGGLYRQYNLTYIVSEERDVVRVRTNYRKGEEAYLYRTRAGLVQTRQRFLEYIRSINQLHNKPYWYNAVVTNCTTGIRSQHPAAERMPWDWRLLVNGKADELMYERKTIETGSLPFVELKRRALINSAAQAANHAADFSTRIREGRPGM
jgi:hypothetical protein